MLNIEENLRKYNITIPKANKPVAKKHVLFKEGKIK